jgi:hypothetical protein
VKDFVSNATQKAFYSQLEVACFVNEPRIVDIVTLQREFVCKLQRRIILSQKHECDFVKDATEKHCTLCQEALYVQQYNVTMKRATMNATKKHCTLGYCTLLLRSILLWGNCA